MKGVCQIEIIPLLDLLLVKKKKPNIHVICIRLQGILGWNKLGTLNWQTFTYKYM